MTHQFKVGDKVELKSDSYYHGGYNIDKNRIYVVTTILIEGGIERIIVNEPRNLNPFDANQFVHCFQDNDFIKTIKENTRLLEI